MFHDGGAAFVLLLLSLLSLWYWNNQGNSQ